MFQVMEIVTFIVSLSMIMATSPTHSGTVVKFAAPSSINGNSEATKLACFMVKRCQNICT